MSEKVGNKVTEEEILNRNVPPIQSPSPSWRRRRWWQNPFRKRRSREETPANTLADSKVPGLHQPTKTRSPNSPLGGLHPSFLVLGSTLTASFVGSTLTYPAEKWRTSWEQSALQRWNFNNATAQIKSNRALVPFVRLWTNHLASTALESMAIPAASTSDDDSQLPFTSSALQTNLIAGTIAGTCQVALLVPLQFYQSYLRHMKEVQQAQSWKFWLELHFFEGGSWDPIQRHKRIVQGIQLQAAREILFNVTFFPLFSLFQRSLDVNAVQDSDEPVPNLSKMAAKMVTSGIAAGVLSALLSAPLDIGQVYFRHSREKWNWWRGAQLEAPPLSLLGRGLVLQAFGIGPTFGLVAAIYELTMAS